MLKINLLVLYYNYSIKEVLFMFQIIDKQNFHLPVKSGFKTPGQALKWARKNLEPGSCLGWGEATLDARYLIKRYHK